MEGYSPKLIRNLNEQRVACLTCNKHPKEDWRDEEFFTCLVTLVSGEEVKMRLAERGSFSGEPVWVREIRKLSEGGHQTSILSNDYGTDMEVLASDMFARWCQENYFKYMRQEYDLDSLATYGAEDIPDNTRVVNPQYRRLDGRCARQQPNWSGSAPNSRLRT